MSSSSKPNTKTRDDDGHLTVEVVRGIITNPAYAGVGEYPRIVPDQTWIEANKVAIEKDGIEQYLTNLIYCVEQSFGCKIENKEVWKKSAETNIKNCGKEKFLKIFLINIRNVFRNSYIKRRITLPIPVVILQIINNLRIILYIRIIKSSNFEFVNALNWVLKSPKSRFLNPPILEIKSFFLHVKSG